MMLYTLGVIGSMLVLEAAIPQLSASSDRFYAGGFQSVRGFEFRGAELPVTYVHAGGFDTVRGFEFRETAPVSGRFYAGGFRSLRGFQIQDVSHDREGK
jgi:outer membrane translocation and assembly module TamA